MLIQPHPGLRLQARRIGAEGAPLLVIDQAVADPDRLVRKAARGHFTPQGAMFPGLRIRAPLSYEVFLERLLRPLLEPHFGLSARSRLAFPMCHYSLVTTPPERLDPLQRVPHVDSVQSNGLATVHYLFRGDWGGTAFYRHRGTCFEVVDDSRSEAYFARLQDEVAREDATGPGYINGDSPLFERVDSVDGVYNRLVVYRRNSLHSGNIDSARVPPADALAGRLSINSFIDVFERAA
ncbi:DUF6445 family protein [Luteimonas composti]|uniref:DUF6445 family protein n=1 Tax=Luteimonas composti TaxID=398257 RepID=A0ABT6MT62_9GAMM|nr:DUF6445 family protein [Luteimonas composti]MDH7453773.1 DUF6445 family protein [Luteimonas composti]